MISLNIKLQPIYNSFLLCNSMGDDMDYLYLDGIMVYYVLVFDIYSHTYR